MNYKYKIGQILEDRQALKLNQFKMDKYLKVSSMKIATIIKVEISMRIT